MIFVCQVVEDTKELFILLMFSIKKLENTIVLEVATNFIIESRLWAAIFASTSARVNPN